jgi:S-adenosylmethionine hydrolase
MKGVILQQSDARLVDVAHDFPRQDVRAAAFWLREVLPYFLPAVHLVVVDPGVGTDRAALVVRVGDHAIVAPDNGVVLPAARRLATDADQEVEVFEWHYENPESATFHGRDVFAPAAAAVHDAGVPDLDSLDPVSPAADHDDLAFPDPELTDSGARGEVLVVDGFGNAITNVPGSVLDGRFGGSVAVDGERAPVRRAYAEVEAGERLVTVGSHGNVELATNRGRGDESFGVRVGESARLSF